MQKLTIVGSGTAGLVTALILRQRFEKLNITVISSSNIGIIGVGEGTTEHWSDFINFCGISAADLIKNADATFKFGVKFENWSKKDYLHYVNGYPHQHRFGQYPLLFGKFISEKIESSKIHPANILRNTIFDSHLPNQYHFNTQKLNDLLKNACLSRNIEIVEDEITDVIINNNKIKSIKGKKEYTSDFYVDCTGFKRLLISKLGATWEPYTELVMNEAIAFQTEDTDEYNCYTLARAMKAGWLWRIPTFGRWGNGYVYSNKYSNKEEAKKEVEKFLKQKIKIAKHIKFEAGRIKTPWINNCCAIGLSASFAEPLEASNIGVGINQAFLLIHYLSNYSKDDIEQYNQKCNSIFDNVRDFVLIHYMVDKKDSKFWKELKLKIPEKLNKKLKMWKNRLCINEDFDNNYLLFSEYNFLLVLYGIDFFDHKKILKEYKDLNPLAHNAADSLWNQFLDRKYDREISHKGYLMKHYRSQSLFVKHLKNKKINEI